ncbi:hemolysin family protein [Clostridium sp. BJN0001]|uniref:HlyC/CorC family transporter n=1 Tax=Clostridium sp. BJN0001 TaxID=2930219 RepID=UPI001FD2F211|nr:hemolysin family protein [Clostridium sp. BJN0001]
MSETALMSINKIRLRHMVDEKVPNAKLVEKLIDNPNKLLGAILIGNNVVNILASSLATVVATTLAGSRGVGIATGIMTILILIFGEITPKSIAKQMCEKVSLKVIRPIKYIVIVLTPFVYIFNIVSAVFIRLLGGRPQSDETSITEEELKTMVGVSEEEGVLEYVEKEMIFNVFDFVDLQVKDVMVQRVDVIAIDKESTYDEVLDVIKNEQFSRIPVYDETIDNIIGILNIKDIAMIENLKENFKVTDYIREPFYTFEFKKIVELFKEMKKTRNPMSVVLDEYGGTVGVVTIEDLVEEIVGEIEDEYDEDKKSLEVINKNEYVVDGSIRLNDLGDFLHMDLESEEFDSVGGIIIGELGRIPEKGEEVTIKDITYKVESVDKNRVKKVKVYVNREIENNEENDGDGND